MMRKNNLKIIKKVIFEMFSKMPFSCIFTWFNNIVCGIFPAINLFILTNIYTYAEKYITSGVCKKELIICSIIMLCSYFIKQILSFFSSIITNAYLYEKSTDYFNEKLYEATSKNELINYENEKFLELLKRAKDCVSNEKMSNLFISISSIIVSLINIISVVLILLKYNWFFIIIAFVSIIPYYLAKIIRGKDFYKMKWIQVKKNRRLSYLYSLYTTLPVIKEKRIFGFEKYIDDMYIKCRDEVNEELFTERKKDTFSFMICEIFKIIGYALSVIFSIYLTKNMFISIAIFGACIQTMNALQNATKTLLIEIAELQTTILYVNDYYDFINVNLNQINNEKKEDFNEIKLNNVSFAYPNNSNNVLNNINLSIKKGERIVLVGENGSGKSTLIKLILGIYKPKNGEILYDDMNLNNIDTENLYKKISIVLQNFIKYKLTLKENICISNIENINNDYKIIETMKKCGVDSLLNDITLDSQLSKEFDGAELSGGQWQKLAITRCIFKEALFLIMDEPTSAIDPLIENDILNKFLELSKNKTSIIVTHRLAICPQADKIIVLKNGNIIEEGKHKELIKLNGEYKKLYEAQQKWYK